MQKRSPDRSAGPLRWLGAALTGLLPTPPTPAQITKGLSIWLDEKRGSRHLEHSYRICRLCCYEGCTNCPIDAELHERGVDRENGGEA